MTDRSDSDKATQAAQPYNKLIITYNIVIVRLNLTIS